MDPKKAADDLAKLTQNPVPNLTEEIKQFESIRRGGKEMEPRSEKKALVEIPDDPEIEKSLEKEGYVEKVEKSTELKKPILDDYTQQLILNSSAPQNPKVKLPLDNEQIEKGLHHHVWEAIRWLAEWCVRQLKMKN